MQLSQILAVFAAEATQSDNLIAHAHQQGSGQTASLPAVDREQITVAAFLNLYIGWETFLESSLLEFMIGSKTLSGAAPVRNVCPADEECARAIVRGCRGFFDYGNPDFVKTTVNVYFANGYPFEPPLSQINQDLFDLRTLRNSAAHITASTQNGLEKVARQVFSGVPRPKIRLYTLLMSPDHRTRQPNTVYTYYRDRLLTTAQLIVLG